jgi:hypothetical protein
MDDTIELVLQMTNLTFMPNLLDETRLILLTDNLGDKECNERIRNLILRLGVQSYFPLFDNLKNKLKEMEFKPTKGWFKRNTNHLKYLEECPICLIEKKSRRQLKCGHAFCTNCISDWITAKLKIDKPNCPICRYEIPLK